MRHPALIETEAYLRAEYVELVRAKLERAYDNLAHDLKRALEGLDAWAQQR